MRKISVAGYRQWNDTSPGVWDYIIYISLSIVLIIAAGKFVFKLVPKRSEFARTEQVALKKYRQYSQRLDAISQKYAKEMESLKDAK